MRHNIIIKVGQHCLTPLVSVRSLYLVLPFLVLKLRSHSNKIPGTLWHRLIMSSIADLRMSWLLLRSNCARETGRADVIYGAFIGSEWR